MKRPIEPCKCVPCRDRNDPCPNVIEGKWWMCRSCAIGAHRRSPCIRYIEERYPFPPLCVRCGYSRVEHGSGRVREGPDG